MSNPKQKTVNPYRLNVKKAASIEFGNGLEAQQFGKREKN
jgi:hypothetical protein